MTQRFTARAPDPTVVKGHAQDYLCGTVAQCDTVLLGLRERLARVALHPKLIAETHADIDAVLDRRTKVAFREAVEAAAGVARET
jgi:hypothetical protein